MPGIIENAPWEAAGPGFNSTARNFERFMEFFPRMPLTDLVTVIAKGSAHTMGNNAGDTLPSLAVSEGYSNIVLLMFDSNSNVYYGDLTTLAAVARKIIPTIKYPLVDHPDSPTYETFERFLLQIEQEEGDIQEFEGSQYYVRRFENPDLELFLEFDFHPETYRLLQARLGLLE